MYKEDTKENNADGMFNRLTYPTSQNKFLQIKT